MRKNISLVGQGAWSFTYYYGLASPSGALQGGGTYTVGALIVPHNDTPPAQQTLFGNLSNNDGYELTVETSGQVQATVGTGSGTVAATSSFATTDLLVGKPLLVVAEANAGGTLNLYVNGRIQANPALAATGASSAALNMGVTVTPDEAASETSICSVFFHGGTITAEAAADMWREVLQYGDLAAACDASGVPIDHVWGFKYGNPAGLLNPWPSRGNNSATPVDFTLTTSGLGALAGIAQLENLPLI